MDDYEILEELGQGIQGKTYLAKYLPLSLMCCLKEIECTDSDQAHNIFEETLSVNKSLGNEDSAIVVPFCMFIHWDASITSFFFYQAYDRFERGDLKRYMEKRNVLRTPISEKAIRKCIGEMIIICKFLKSKNIIHRSIRPSNFFFGSKMNIKISDICCSYVKKDIKTRTRISTGCLTFAAPEIVVYDEEDNHVTDFWSMGAVILGLLSCSVVSYPDLCANLNEYKFSNKALDFIFNALSSIYSQELITTIKDILGRDKGKRINLDTLNDYLNGILQEIDTAKQRAIDGVLEPLDTTQQLDYYFNYLKTYCKSRLCFRELLLFLDENITESWSLFSFDDNTCYTLLNTIVQHQDSEDLCGNGMKIIGIQAIGQRQNWVKKDSEMFEIDALSKICYIAEKYPFCQDVQYATAKIFYSCSNHESKMLLYRLNAVKILIEMMKSFSSYLDTMSIVMKAFWPMMQHSPNAKKVHEFSGSSLVVKVTDNYVENINFFKVASLVIYGISFYDPNVIDLNKCDCIPVLLNGLSIHRDDPEAVTNACNALTSMLDAEEESVYIMVTTTVDSDNVTGIVLIGVLCQHHMHSQDVVLTILKVFTSLCRHDDILSEMKCSVVGEAINNLSYAYIDIDDVSSVCSQILNKIKTLKPLTQSNRLPQNSPSGTFD